MVTPLIPNLISLVIPAYNEEKNLVVLVEQLRAVMQSSLNSYEILIIDDGSIDNTKEVLKRLSHTFNEVRFISFSRNFGHQAALRAGYDHARGDCAISLDADLQHPPELIPTLIKKWREGFDVVYTTRTPDPNLPWSKRFTSRNFYKFLRATSGLELEEGAADFRLLDRKVLNVLKQFKETDLFLRGMISWMGFRQCRIAYKPGSRFAGTTKYSFRKMLQLAIMGITSFTSKPLYLSVAMGFMMSLFATLTGLEVLYEYFFTKATVSGWTTLVVLTVFIGGAQFIVIGIMGVYLGKTFDEVKRRPPYIIGDTSEIEEVSIWQSLPHETYSSQLM
ncbi:glycosyltransferase family 2 protein [Fibrella aquatica]|uniref:glycosyltransferase family 2 protein n=1 Tax=Fibrella aquatica TaxID=3242487 RepID=UPI0035211CFD